MDALTDLLEASDYNIRRAQNGQEALVLAKGRPPGMILLDFVDAGNRWEFMRRQRLERAIAEIPIVVITALVSAVPASVKALVTKPFDVNRLTVTGPEILHVPKLANLIFSRGISWTSK